MYSTFCGFRTFAPFFFPLRLSDFSEFWAARDLTFRLFAQKATNLWIMKRHHRFQSLRSEDRVFGRAVLQGASKLQEQEAKIKERGD